MTKFLYSIALCTVLLWCITGTALAQEVPPGASTGDISADDVNVVARELWCPLCSGVRLDACELKACDQMKDVIAIKLAEGEDTESIKAYFVEQYGPQVLGEPPREGFNWLAWILPIVAFVIGGVFVWGQVGRMIRRPAAADNTGDRRPASSSTPANSPVDEYERKLNEELSRYG